MINALRAWVFIIPLKLEGCIRLCTGHCNSIFLLLFLSLSLSLSLCPSGLFQWNKLRTRYIGDIEVDPQERQMLELRVIRDKGRPTWRRWTQGHFARLSITVYFQTQANFPAAKERFLQTCHSIAFQIPCCSILQRLALQNRVVPGHVLGHQTSRLVYLGCPLHVSGPVQSVRQDPVARCHICDHFLVGLQLASEQVQLGLPAAQLLFLQRFLLCIDMAIVISRPQVRDHGLVEDWREAGGHLFHLCSEDAFGKILRHIGEDQVHSSSLLLPGKIGPFAPLKEI